MDRDWKVSCTRSSRLLALALLATLGPGIDLGCGEGEVPIEEACRTTVDALCDAAARCGLAPSDSTLCRRGFGVPYLTKCNSIIDRVEEGEVVYDGREVYRCLELLDQVKCNAMRGDALASCYTFGVSGKKADGDECDPGDVFDCKAGLKCQVKDGQPTCAALPKSGEACTQVCEPGYTCNRATQVCEDKATAGQCCQDKGCEDDLRCDPTGTPTCVAYGAEGDFCASDSTCGVGLTCRKKVCTPMSDKGKECGSHKSCVIGLVCDPYSRTCKSEKDMM